MKRYTACDGDFVSDFVVLVYFEMRKQNVKKKTACIVALK